MQTETKPGVEEMNRVIAEFDGWEFVQGHDHKCASCDEGYAPSMYCTCDKKKDRLEKDGSTWHLPDVCYHEKWELLMPVYENLLHQYYQTYEGNKDQEQMKRRFTNIQGHLLHARRTELHREISEYISYLNSTTPPSGKG